MRELLLHCINQHTTFEGYPLEVPGFTDSTYMIGGWGHNFYKCYHMTVTMTCLRGGMANALGHYVH